MRVQRSTLIAQLETVRHGLSPKDIVDQASCFAFRDGKVFTFNDEVACWGPSAFNPEGKGIVVPSGPLLALLPKLPDDELDFSFTDEGLVIKGKNKRTKIRVEGEIRLPIDTVTIAKPGDYFDAPDGFVEGLSLVEKCAGTDDADFKYTCINMTPKWIEACDNSQIARFRMKLPGLTDGSFLVRKEAIKSVLSLDVKKIATSGAWVFFKDDRGVVIACRRYVEEYLNLTAAIELVGSGVPAELPKGLGDAATNAAIFSAENGDDDQVLVKLKAGVASITGEGATGSHNELRRVKYDGPPVSFRISPKLLVRITTDYPECEVSGAAMRVVVGRLTYVVSLAVPEADKSEEAE